MIVIKRLKEWLIDLWSLVPEEELNKAKDEVKNNKRIIGIKDKAISDLHDEVNKLRANVTSLENENKYLQREVEKERVDPSELKDKVVIDYKTVYLVKNIVDHIYYYDKGRDLYSKVEFRFYNPYNKVIHTLVFDSSDKYSVNGTVFEWGKAKKMKEYLDQLIAEKSDIYIAEVQ